MTMATASNEPNSFLITEATSSLAKATTCRSCHRRPLHLCFTPGTACYDGPLLASISCGCLFCRDCYAAASGQGSVGKGGEDCDELTGRDAKCPVCLISCTVAPRAIIPWLAHENNDITVSIHSDVRDDRNNSRHENLVWLNSMLGTINPQIDYGQDVDSSSQSFDLLESNSNTTGIDDCERSIDYTPFDNLDDIKFEEVQCGQHVDESEVLGTDLFALKRNMLERSPNGDCLENERTAHSTYGQQFDFIQGIESSSESFDLLDSDGDDKSMDYTPCNNLNESELEKVVDDNDTIDPCWKHNLSQVDETEVPGTDLSAVKRHLLERSLVTSCLKSHNQEKPKSEPASEDRQVSEEITPTFLPPCEQEFVPRYSQPYSHGQTEEVPVTDVSFLRERVQTGGGRNQSWTPMNYDEVNCSTEQTKEVPGTHLSFLDRQRLLKSTSRQIYSSMHHDDCEGNPASSLPQFTELDNGQTKEAPGTYLSFPIRQRVSTSKNDLSESFMHRDNKAHCSDSPGRQETHVDHAIPEHFNTNEDVVDCSQPSTIPSHSESHRHQHIEEVSGTCLSFLDKNRALTVVYNEANRDCLAESLRCKVPNETTNGKRRRVSASPRLRLPDEKISDIGDGANGSKICNRLSTPKDMVEGESSTKKRRVTSSSVPLSSDKTNKHESIKPIGMQLGGKQLCIAYDVLDSTEANALEWLNKEGFCFVVDGVYSVPSHDGRGCIPFPSVLVTHAFGEPGTITGDKKSVPMCLRSYKYLKAMALGAQVIDAKWLLDSHHAGVWLDYESYTTRCDLDTYEAQHIIARPRDIEIQPNRLPLAGLMLGILGSEMNPNDYKQKILGLQLQLMTGDITSQEIMELIKCWGGRCSLDALAETNNAILVPSWKSLHCIVKNLRSSISSISSINKWSIESFDDERAARHVLIQSKHDDTCVHLPLIRAKWLEDSICSGSLLNLKKYCCGVLRLQYPTTK